MQVFSRPVCPAGRCPQQQNRQPLSSSPGWQIVQPCRRHSRQLRALQVLESPLVQPASGRELRKPDAAGTARTICDITRQGTLSTVGEDGVPLGTYVTYVLDSDGQPLLRLRADAVHTANLLREPRCSLFVQPTELPARNLARTTLIGRVTPVNADLAAQAAERHAAQHARSAGVDAPQTSDLFYKLELEQCFFVGGMGSTAAAEVLSREDYLAGVPDELRFDAAPLLASFNQTRADDVLRIGAYAAASPLESMYVAELLWIDTLGVFVRVAGAGKPESVVRVQFHRAVSDYRDARSVLTLLAQVAWERDREYNPAPPSAVEAAV